MIFNFIKLLTILFIIENKAMQTTRGLRQINIIPLKNINKGMALSFDIVQVFDEECFKALKTMDAKTFNEKKKELKQSYMNDISIWQFDTVNSSRSQHYVVQSSRPYYGIIIFFHFSQPLSQITKFIFPTKKVYNLDFHIKNNQVHIKKSTTMESSCKYLRSRI